MNTIRFDEIEDVKMISEFTIRDRVWFTYYNDISETIRVIDKILGAALPWFVNSENEAKEFLSSMSDEKLQDALQLMGEYLKENNIKEPIN